MSPLQIKYHQDTDIQVTTNTIGVDDRGVFLDYQANQFADIWGDETAAEILANLEKDTNTFIEHCPPEKPNHDDVRFKELYDTDKSRADELGLPCGVHHMSCRREIGQNNVVPSLTEETLKSRHRFGAIVAYVRAITPVIQTIGMGLAVRLPTEYENAREIVKYWEENSAFNCLVHSERATATTFVLNTNTFTGPHYDSGDSDDTMTGLMVWGDFDRTKGGHLSIPILGRSFVMRPGAVLWLRAREFLHFVTRPIVSQRFSLVFTTQKNMVPDPNTMRLPPTPLEKSMVVKDARKNDTLKNCPFCGLGPFEGGLQSVNKHLKRFEKPGDDKHDPDKTEEFDRQEKARKEKPKLGKRRLEETAHNSGGESDDSKQGPTAERQRMAKRVKKLPLSLKYERFGAALFAENIIKEIPADLSSRNAASSIDFWEGWVAAPPFSPVSQPRIEPSEGARWRESRRWPGQWTADFGVAGLRFYLAGLFMGPRLDIMTTLGEFDISNIGTKTLDSQTQ
ncbi:hypothetical protein DL98DRAFT_587214 [Cadophora sp. DSE1049]|nr:hypothetical protein DL98DRAFT_587214 [Cadophora sp. DSE1049]